MENHQVLRVKAIHDGIMEFCDFHRNLGSGWGQYKDELFAVFRAAYHHGLCGRLAHERDFKNAKKQTKHSQISDSWFVCGQSIKEHLNDHWKDDPNARVEEKWVKNMVDGVVTCWDAWVFAWDRWDIPQKVRKRLNPPYVKWTDEFSRQQRQ